MAAVEIWLLLVRCMVSPCETRAESRTGNASWASPKQMTGDWLQRATPFLVCGNIPPEKKEDPQGWPCAFSVPLAGTSEGSPSKQG